MIRLLKKPSLLASSNPFNKGSLNTKLFLGPLICIIAPYKEEEMFRGDLQESIKNRLRSFYEDRGLSQISVDILSRITSVFFTSILFGAIHFTNAIFLFCNPVLLLPQVIATTVMGIVFGLAKELSGKLNLPIGMHMGNNFLAWASMLNSRP